jgi:hypothetical protein
MRRKASPSTLEERRVDVDARVDPDPDDDRRERDGDAGEAVRKKGREPGRPNRSDDERRERGGT